ncbi:MAG: RdgB/HAM1 family non-canonical purine NTP pyrophosphatase [Actinobacteria bacterium]|uniref:dITP/XTP pyrophosphatase n=1 Tax=freshwater metagenome TaxID=449393 RepID=A0A6J6HB71_9ZZZZ|nr:RdgB/HAM1 family non-canonical purine NTP pyrophosphatase [Actinomycetota bacterium]
MRQIVLATQNQGKIAEFERLLSQFAQDIQVLGLRDFPDMPDIEETGRTFSENALLKAHGVCEFTSLPALADDSGLCIDYLNGDPGIFSARWAGNHGDDLANITKVLSQLIGVEEEQRSAHFVCEVALVFPAGHKSENLEVMERGELAGFITLQPRGTAGFGYDPIFQPAGQQLTLGEFAHGEKDKISHRGIALRAIAPRIKELL